MTGRFAPLGGTSRVTRALALAALLCAALGFALSRVVQSPSAGSLPARVATVRAARGLGLLPASALAPVSGYLGAQGAGYSFHAAGAAGFSAAGGVDGLAVAASRTGVTLTAHTLKLGLSLSAVGYGGRLEALGAAEPTASANRISYARGSVGEWYLNGPAGLEQGFTVTHAPALTHATRVPLTLAVSLSGNAHASLGKGGRSIDFSRAGAPTLSYGGLVARDASGRTVRSWMSLSHGRLLLGLDAAGARYPLRIDPLVKQSGKLKAGEALEGGRLGFSVALSSDGNTALVGAPGYNAGVAWIFVRSGSTWTQQGAALIGSELEGAAAGEHCGEEENEPAGQCGFGRSVALSGDGNTALIGGPRDGHNAGAAWVFVREGSSWAQQGPKLTGFEEGGEGRFGHSVALSADGSTALMGGPSDVDGRGAAWVFTRSGSTWSPQGPKIMARESEQVGEGHLGGSVALSSDGSTAIVGSPGDSHYTGAIWAFTRSGESWHQQGGKITAGGELGEGHFGASVAVSADGNTALAGARNDQGTPGVAVGAAWAYTRSGSTWSQLGPELLADDESGAGEFGYSVALAGNGESALIGGPRDGSSIGAAWSFTRSSAGFAQAGKKIETAEEAGKGFFGASVALDADGETALAGSPYDARRIGAAYAFVESALPAAPEVSKVSPTRGPRAGGTTVTITGANFTGATGVAFGTTSASEFTVDSANSITAVSPAGTGTVDVTVTGAGGVSATVEGDSFEYIVPGSSLPPSVGSVLPAEGPSTGGTTVTITGSSLAGVTAVKFGAVAARSFTMSSNGSITAVTPAQAPGAVDVTVTNAIGSSQTTKRDLFTFVAPGAGGSSVTGAGGVLGFGAASGLCRVTLISKRIAVQKPGRAALRLLVGGSGRCVGKLRLRVKLKAAHGRFKLQTIGTAVFSAPAGRGTVIRVKLNAAGRRLLARGHGRLNASILITRVTPAPLLAQSASVRLTRVKAAKATPKGR